MKKISLLLTLILISNLMGARTVVSLATPAELEAAGLSSEPTEIPGGTVIFDNEIATFSLAYTDDWGTDEFYGIHNYDTSSYRIKVGNSEEFTLGISPDGQTNPIFNGYQNGVMSGGTVFKIDVKQTGWITCPTILLNPAKQYVVFENTTGALPYTLGAVGGNNVINYCLPIQTSGDEAGLIDFNSINAPIYFYEKRPDQTYPLEPYKVVSLEDGGVTGLGYLTFKVTAGNSYYVSGLGTGILLQGFVFTDDATEPAVTFLATDNLPEVKFGIRGTIPKLKGEHFESDGIVYTVIDPEAKTVKTRDGYDDGPGNNYSGDLVIPEVVNDGLNDYTVTEIGKWSFKANDGLTSVSLPSSILTIGEGAFSSCTNLTSVATQESLTRIESSTFEGCNNLSTISLPASLETLDIFSFSGCNALTEITYYATLPIGIDGTYVFDDIIFANTTLNMPNALLDDIRSVAPWDRFAHIIASDGTLEPSEPVNGEMFEYAGIWYTVIDAEGRKCKTKNGNDIGPGNPVEGNIEIPQTVSKGTYDFTVVEIGEKSFYGCDNLISIKLPATVEYIRESAFENCTALTSIDMPENLIEIRNLAFAGCENLQAISFADSVQELGSNTFAYCKSLTSIVLPPSLKNIGVATFKECSGLESVTFPAGFESIGFWGFLNCTSLKSLEFPNSMLSIGELAFENCSALESVTFGNSLETIANHAFVGCSSLLSVELPASLSSIGSTAFSECSSLTTAVFNGNPTSIDMGIFKNCSNLVNVTLPTELKAIKPRMFENCSSLTSLQLPSNVTQIEDAAFKGCSQLVSLEIPSNLKSIGENGFNGCSALESITLPMSLATLGNEAFSDCIGLKSVDFQSLETEIGTDAFINCSSLQSVNLPSTLLTIERGTFANCSSLSSINFPETLTKIGDSAFICCGSLEVLEFPDALTNIEASAFQECSSLKSISFPSEITQISTFTDCNNIIEVNYSASTLPETGAGFESIVYDNATLNMPNATLEDIQATEPWRNFKHIVASDGTISPDLAEGDDFEYEGIIYTVIDADAKTVKTKDGYIDNGTYIRGNNCSGDIIIPSSVSNGTNNYTVTAIGQYGFYNCTELTSIVLPENITYIGRFAFTDCSSLTSFNIPDGVTSIELGVFLRCPNLSSINIPESVTSIKESAFDNCIRLTSIILPEGLTSIGTGAFRYCGFTSIDIPDRVTAIENEVFKHCSSLTSINIGDSVTSIGEYAFYYCTNLTSINIGESVTTIEKNAFEGCSALTSINIPDGVTSIREYAFYGCSDLTSINIPDGVNSIEGYTFYGCSNLTSINIPESVTSIGVYAFWGCDKLEEITYMASTPIEANENVFSSLTYDAATLLTPNATLASIQATVPWNKFSRITASDGSIKPALSAGDDFEYEGIWYTVLDADAKTCETKAGVLVDPSSVGANIIEGDQVIPQTVTDGADQYTVVSIGNHSFAHSEGLTSLSLPESIAEIGTTAFMDCSALQSINMPEGLNIIKDSAFLRCISLISVVVPQSVTVLESGAFDGCSSLVSATLPESLTSIRTLLFCNCSSLESITIPEGVTSIGSQAFLHCENLQSLDLPLGITSIGYRAFEGCTKLTSLTLPENLTTLQNSVFYGCSGLTTLNLPEALEVIEVNAFNRCSGLISLIIPESVKQIKTYAFKDCSSLKSVSLPSNLESIDEAFIGCPLETVNYSATIPVEASETVFDDSTYQSATLNTPNATLESVQATVPWNRFLRITASDGSIEPSLSAGDDFVYNGMTYTIIDADAKTCKTKDSWYENAGELPEDFFAGDFEIPATVSDGSNDYTVVEIGLHTFDLCEPLTSIILPETLKTIDIYAFESCHNLVSANIPASVDSIGYRAFADCSKLESISIPESMTSLASSVFSGCRSLAEVHLPDAMTSIGDYCFNECDALSSINFPSSLTEIKDGAFSTCGSLTSVTLPEGLLSVGSSAFASCHSLSQLSIPESLISIGYHGFWGCDMASLTLPASLTSIGEGAFERCEKIRVVNYNATSPITAPDNIFDTEVVDIYNVATLNTPNATLETVQATIPWNKFLRITASNGSIEPEIKVESITLSQTSAQLKVGESLTLSATVLPKDATNTPITWTSSNTEIATVDTEGNVTAIALGEATITASCGEATATCTISVVATPVESITLSQTSAQLRVGETLTLSATVLPENVTDKTVTWTSSDTEIATVDNEGNVTAIALGEATITATCGAVTATCSISVVSTPVESITLSLTSAQLKIGESVTLSATVLPEDATDKTVTWTSSDTETATVDNKGNVTAIALGEATITATCGEVTATCILSVVATPVESITLSNTSAQLKVGESLTLTATVLPEDATDKTVTWTSSNPEIATVDNEGNVTAIALGEAAITASCGEATASCTVSVVQTPVESITLSDTSAELQVGESIALSVTVLPEDATDKTVTWTSTNSEIATVDSEGLVTAIAAGEATITASCGEITATCTVTVSSNALSAGDDFEYEGVIYTVIDADAMTCRNKAGHYEDHTLIPGNNFEGDLVIPAIAIYSNFEYTVVEIGRYGFGFNAGLTSVIIPETITNIPESAFENCTNLTSASIPESVTSIGIYAFDECENLMSVDLPKNLKSMGYAAYRKCSSITSIVIPESLTVLENHVFESCNNLKTIDIPASITQIDSYAFYGCNNSAEITYRAEVPIEAPQDIFNEGIYQYGTLITPNATLESVQATVPWNNFVRISASDASTFIPNDGDSFSHEGIVYTIINQENHTLKTADGSVEGEGVNNIEGDLVIPSSIEAYDAVYDVIEIGAYSFAGSSFLTSVTIPATIENIGEGAFSDSERLTSIIWEGQKQVPNKMIDEIGNPNLLIYVDSIQFAPAGIDQNIVVLKTADGVPSCENLVLIKGYAFRPAIDFISQNSSLTQDFTQTTVIGECAGWESLVLPFDVKSIYNDKCGELTPFAALTDIETQYPFWLYQADEEGEWKESADIRAGIPYIISMPNNPEYLERFNIDGPVKFACPEPAKITREIASPYAVNWASGQVFSSMWLPLEEKQAANVMGLNVGISGLTDDNGDELLPGSAFCEGITPRPLEAYVTRQGAELAKRIIGTQTSVRTVDSINGLEIKAYIGKIIITSDSDRKIDIFAIDGTHIRSLIVKGGTTEIVRDLTKGLYLVAGQKILVK